MGAVNYDSALDQVRSAGLLVSHLEVGPAPNGKPWRCRVEGGDKEKRGWYLVHEIQASGGDVLLVGTYGVYRGNDPGTLKIEIEKGQRDALSSEQREALKKRLAEDRRKAAEDRRKLTDYAARKAAAAWARYSPTGEAEYLVRKGVQGYGVRYTPEGAVVVPMMNAAGEIRGLQIIRSHAQASKTGKLAKQFWPAGHEMAGTWFQIGAVGWVVLVAEGYATAASLHAATGLPVAVAWAANNVGKVAAALAAKHPGAKILLCADDDDLTTCPVTACAHKFQLGAAPSSCPACGQAHKRTNAGVDASSAAALAVGGGWLRPYFSAAELAAARWTAYAEHGAKWTDFNDLHLAPQGGLHLVREQVSAKLRELGWAAPAAASPPQQGGGGALRPIDTLEELLERFALVYGQGGTVFDRAEHRLVALGDMRDACIRRDLHRSWCEHAARSIVRVDEVGFDPTERDPAITCNLWGGWPTVAKAGDCCKLLDLLLHMCSGEPTDTDEQRFALYKWLLSWLAYPIQHPGAKMQTTVVVHGPQGTGKNLFFEAYMGIFGRYGRVIDQSAIEDKFNDWASRKLFLIADEVVARSDLYHVKNKLKAFITGDWIRINPKNMAAYDEKNHCNIVFLSNEAVPVALEKDDRRHAVIWTPAKLDPDFYAAVRAEIANGGVAALHDYLLNFPLGDFTTGTHPPMTGAKRTLIGLGLDSTVRFYDELEAGELQPCQPQPALSSDVYDLYKLWCQRTGRRQAPMDKLLDALERRVGAPRRRMRYYDQIGGTVQGTVMLMGRTGCPPGMDERQWIGDSVSAWRLAMGQYERREKGAP